MAGTQQEDKMFPTKAYISSEPGAPLLLSGTGRGGRFEGEGGGGDNWPAGFHKRLHILYKEGFFLKDWQVMLMWPVSALNELMQSMTINNSEPQLAREIHLSILLSVI